MGQPLEGRPLAGLGALEVAQLLAGEPRGDDTAHPRRPRPRERLGVDPGTDDQDRPGPPDVERTSPPDVAGELDPAAARHPDRDVPRTPRRRARRSGRGPGSPRGSSRVRVPRVDRDGRRSRPASDVRWKEELAGGDRGGRRSGRPAPCPTRPPVPGRRRAVASGGRRTVVEMRIAQPLGKREPAVTAHPPRRGRGRRGPSRTGRPASDQPSHRHELETGSDVRWRAGSGRRSSVVPRPERAFPGREQLAAVRPARAAAGARRAGRRAARRGHRRRRR